MFQLANIKGLYSSGVRPHRSWAYKKNIGSKYQKRTVIFKSDIVFQVDSHRRRITRPILKTEGSSFGFDIFFMF